MSCYVSGVPYSPVLVTCGFQEEQGGAIVDCIQTLNMSGINELLVSQRQGSAGALMSNKRHHHPESLHELEELLDFPPQMLNEVELNSRFQSLCKVIQNARDTFSSGHVGEESQEEHQENNPFQELHVQLQKATDRFHARVAAVDGGNNKKLACGCRRLFRRTTKSGSNKHRDVNPYRELRDSMRMARRHFIPLIDQYMSSRNNDDNTQKNSNRKNNNNAPLELRGEEKKGNSGCWNEPTTTTSSGGDISHQAAAIATNCKSTIQPRDIVIEKDYHCPKPRSISIGCNTEVIGSRMTDTETASVQTSRTNPAANPCSTILAPNLTDENSESYLPLNLCNCNKMNSGAAVTSPILTTNSNQPTVADGNQSDGGADGNQSLHPIMTNSTTEMDGYEQLSPSGTALSHTRWPDAAKFDGMSPLFRGTEKNNGTLAMPL